MGKGDTPRLVDQDKYGRNYLRIFGVPCPECNGLTTTCHKCAGVGYVERKRHEKRHS